MSFAWPLALVGIRRMSCITLRNGMIESTPLITAQRNEAEAAFDVPGFDAGKRALVDPAERIHFGRG